ncbi:MAG: hypothetical protein AAGE59_21760 [Cyanobacteria bacterium P01_F01_bin.86]
MDSSLISLCAVLILGVTTDEWPAEFRVREMPVATFTPAGM